MVALFAVGWMGVSVAPSGAATPVSLDSGALGSTRTRIEARFGHVSDPIDVPGHPIYDQTYAYETQAGTLYVSYRDINGEQIAVYLEFAWGGKGVSERDAQTLVTGLLPADAKLTELYIAPPTTSGPIAFVMNRYTSESLGAGGVLASEILVTYQQSWTDGPGGSAVHAVSIAIRERTQLTG
jgi:hypothetical protein